MDDPLVIVLRELAEQQKRLANVLERIAERLAKPQGPPPYEGTD